MQRDENTVDLRADRGVPFKQQLGAYRAGQRASSRSSERWPDHPAPMEAAWAVYANSPRLWDVLHGYDGQTHEAAFMDGWSNFDDDWIGLPDYCEYYSRVA